MQNGPQVAKKLDDLMSKEGNWHVYAKKININVTLFKYGLTVVVPVSDKKMLTVINEKSIHFYGQRSAKNTESPLPSDTPDKCIFELVGQSPEVNNTIPPLHERVLSFLPKEFLFLPEPPKSKSSSKNPAALSATDADKKTPEAPSTIEKASNSIAPPLPVLPYKPNSGDAAEGPDLSQAKYRGLRHAITQNISYLQTLAGFANRQNKPIAKICTTTNQWVLYNKHRRGEVFLPLSINGIGSYVCLSDSKFGKDFSGFRQIVTAGCLFGSGLRARDNIRGGLFPLVKHEIDFSDGAYISSVHLEEHDEVGPYEANLFFELTKMCDLFVALSEPNQPKNLIFHLPDIDYVLFGLKLYLDGKITFEALDEFFNHIFDRKEQFIKKISALCDSRAITATITSPFANLFGENICAKNATKTIFEGFGLPIPKTNITAPLRNNKEYTEHQLVQHCLRKLISNNFYEAHRKAWLDFLRAHAKTFIQEMKQKIKEANDDSISKDCKNRANAFIGGINQKLATKSTYFNVLLSLDDIDEKNYTVEDLLTISASNMMTVEDLFKLANPLVIAVAAKNQPAHKTCSILPLSEKQIHLNYDHLSKKSFLKTEYPAVSSIITMDSTLAYSQATNGFLYYMDVATAEEKLAELMDGRHILEFAANNIDRAICDKPPISLLDVINGVAPRAEYPVHTSSSIAEEKQTKLPVERHIQECATKTDQPLMFLLDDIKSEAPLIESHTNTSRLPEVVSNRPSSPALMLGRLKRADNASNSNPADISDSDILKNSYEGYPEPFISPTGSDTSSVTDSMPNSTNHTPTNSGSSSGGSTPFARSPNAAGAYLHKPIRQAIPAAADDAPTAVDARTHRRA